MGKLIYTMNVSIDGYVGGVDGDVSAMGVPGPKLFDYWIEGTRDIAVEIVGRKVYELMVYWDEDRPEWGEPEREFARFWRRIPKYVVSSTLKEVGLNATLVTGDIIAQVRDLKARTDGTLSVSGPQLAELMTEHGLIDEYQLLVRPYVLGAGKPFFRAGRPRLKLLKSEQIDDETMLLVYGNG